MNAAYSSSESSGRHRSPFVSLVHRLLSPSRFVVSLCLPPPSCPRLLSWRATTRGEVLASPTSTRGVPTILSRIYYAQFSCSSDVSSSLIRFLCHNLHFHPFSSSSAFVFFFFFYLISLRRTFDSRGAAGEFLVCNTSLRERERVWKRFDGVAI